MREEEVAAELLAEAKDRARMQHEIGGDPQTLEGALAGLDLIDSSRFRALTDKSGRVKLADLDGDELDDAADQARKLAVKAIQAYLALREEQDRRA